MGDQRQDAKRQFDESTKEFRKAHEEGMDGLRRGDLNSVDAAIDEERAAIANAGSALKLARAPDGSPPAPDVREPDGRSPDLQDEHERLRLDLEDLQREHHQLEANPRDIAGHELHRKRLQEHIQKLRDHIRRLRDER